MKPKRNIPHAKKSYLLCFFKNFLYLCNVRLKKNTFKKILILKKYHKKKVSIYLLYKEMENKNIIKTNLMIERVNTQVFDLDNVSVEQMPVVEAFTKFDTLAKNALYMLLVGLACNKERVICITQNDLTSLVKCSKKRIKEFLRELKKDGYIDYSLVVGKKNINDMYETTSLGTLIKILK